MNLSKLPNLKLAKMICIDLETFDPNLEDKGPGTFRKDGHIAGIGLKPNDGPGFYLPIGHVEGNLDKGKVIAYCKDVLGTDIPKLGANILYDLEWLHQEGVHVGGRKYDIQVAEPLLDENRFEYNLEDIAQRRLNIGKLHDDLMFECQRLGYKIRKLSNIYLHLYKLHPTKVAGYVVRDLELPFQIFEQQWNEMEEQDLLRVFDVETRLIDLLLKMRIRGVPIDVSRAEQVKVELEKNEKEMLQQLHAMGGVSIDIWAAESVSKAFDHLSINYPRTPKTKAPSFTAPWLEAHTHPFAQLLVKTRKINKLRKDFIESMILDSVINGRIHTQFHPVKHDEGGTVSGRFSSSNPNLQQVPSRDPVNGPLVRGLFVAEPGTLWCKNDFRQQEPRVTVHYAYLRGFKGADVARQKYLDDPFTDYHQMVADLCSIERRPAKDINLGLAYGMGIAKMALKLGKSVEETKQLFQKYHLGVPFVRLLSNDCARFANNRGYIKTLLGRRRRFDLWAPTVFDKENPKTPLPYDKAVAEYGLPLRRAFTHKALNSLIQGTSADMIKKTMLDIGDAGYVPYLTVHDETDVPIEREAQGKELQQIHRDAVKLEVPLETDLFIEKSWGDCK